MKGRHRRARPRRRLLVIGGGALAVAALVGTALLSQPWDGAGDRVATDGPPPSTTTSTRAPGTTVATLSTTTAKALPRAPWAAAPLARDQAPAVALEEWKKAGSPADCRALAPSELGVAAGAAPRRANFGTGAWAFAYDKPGLPGTRANGGACPDCGRGAVLVAGTRVDVEEGEEAAQRPPEVLPAELLWADGSVARYGLEGGDGPDHLAYLDVAGQRCRYVVKSSVGEEHLRFVIDHLRFVEGAP